MSNYDNFALYYDILTDDVDYSSRTDYLLKLFDKHHRMPTLLLDMACGTGSFSLEFAKRNIDVIGVDMSEGMLAVADERSKKENADILFLNQSAQELELYGTVDGAVCCLDSVNHIVRINELKKAFKRISLFLEKDCLFIFDVNTLYKQSRILGNNTFVIENDDVYCVWQNFFDNKSKITDIYIDLFAKTGDEYSRLCENFSERVYSDEQLIDALESAGLKTEAIYGEMTVKKPTKNCMRKVFVTRKVK